MILVITLAKWTRGLPLALTFYFNLQLIYSFSVKDLFCSVKEILPAVGFSSHTNNKWCQYDATSMSERCGSPLILYSVGRWSLWPFHIVTQLRKYGYADFVSSCFFLLCCERLLLLLWGGRSSFLLRDLRTLARIRKCHQILHLPSRKQEKK